MFSCCQKSKATVCVRGTGFGESGSGRCDRGNGVRSWRGERTSGGAAGTRVVGRSGERHANRKRKGVRPSISWPSMRPDTGLYIGRRGHKTSTIAM
jgi:hypothetical protein